MNLPWSKKKEAPIAYNNGSGVVNFNTAPGRQDMTQFLKAYGEDGWLHAAVSRIAQSYAETEWKLYKKDNKTGEREEILQHPLLDLMARPNPYQSGQDLEEILCKFYLLTGKAYQAKQYNMGKQELWLIPSPFMKPVPDKREFIKGYVYERNGERVTFEPGEVIPYINTDPWNIYDGVGPAQAIGLELDMSSYMRQHNRNFFLRGAVPGLIISNKNGATQEEVDRLVEKLKSKHQGYGRAFETLFLSGDWDVKEATISQKDMDFVGLAKWTRDATLGGFGLPPTMIGVAENANRSIAETAEYTYAKWTLKPLLNFFKRKKNEFLVPDFEKDGETLEMDFVDPVPENQDLKKNTAIDGFKAGVITRNEARDIMGFNPDKTELGDEYYTPPPSLSNDSIPPAADAAKEIKKKNILATIEEKDAYWKDYVKGTEAHEKILIAALHEVWQSQKKDVLTKFKTDARPELDISKAKKDYQTFIEDPLEDALLAAIKKGMQLVEPRTPHKDTPIPQILNARALRWLQTRLGWAAEQTSEETATLLSGVIAQAYADGFGADKIANLISALFDGFDQVRALKVARTEVMSASNQGAIEGYRESGVVSTATWFTASDERDCDECDSMDGDTEELDDTEGVLPLHPNCRCIWLANVD